MTEFLATLIFIIVILGATNPTATLEVAGLIIGLTLFALHFAFINVTGLSVNPVRSFGPGGICRRQRSRSSTASRNQMAPRRAWSGCPLRAKN